MLWLIRRHTGLIVDFGGVLTTSIDEAFRSFCQAEGIPHERLKGVLRAAYGVGTDPDPLVARVETGRMELREFEVRLAEALSEDLDAPLDPTDLMARMLSGVHFDLRMVRAVRAARHHGVKTALLSNSWGVQPYPRDLLDELFDAVVISGEVGIRKPDLEVFTLAAQRLGLPPRACVFVDDVKGNVEAARRVGMRGVVHRHAGRTIRRLRWLLRVRLEDPQDPGAAASIDGEVYR